MIKRYAPSHLLLLTLLYLLYVTINIIGLLYTPIPTAYVYFGVWSVIIGILFLLLDMYKTLVFYLMVSGLLLYNVPLFMAYLYVTVSLIPFGLIWIYHLAQGLPEKLRQWAN